LKQLLLLLWYWYVWCFLSAAATATPTAAAAAAAWLLQVLVQQLTNSYQLLQSCFSKLATAGHGF
jgi:hypothetical protein